MSSLYEKITDLYDQDLDNIDADTSDQKVFNFLYRNKEKIESIDIQQNTEIKEAIAMAQRIGYTDGSLDMIKDFEAGIEKLFGSTKNQLSEHFNKLKETLAKIKNQK